MRNAKWWYFGAIVFSIVSSARCELMPELQLMALAFLLLLGASRSVILNFVILIFCTSTYAIPDQVLRMAPGDYPSLYTKELFLSVKVLDVISVLIFLSGVRRAALIKKIRGLGFLPLLLFLTTVSSVINFIWGTNDWSYALFYLRSFMIAAGIFFISSSMLDYRDFIGRVFYSMFCWLSKMLFMILLPSENVIAREIFGFQWKIFFAGDEYLSFGLMSAIIIFVSNSLSSSIDEFRRDFMRCFFFCFCALVFALISQRKGAISYFLIVFSMIYFSAHYLRRGVVVSIFNMLVFTSGSLFYVYFSFFYEMSPDVIKVAVYEYRILYLSAIASMNMLFSDSPLSAIIGIGVSGLYRVFSLPEHADHVFSFGKEVGELFRYAIWNLPMGRLPLNSGLLGSVLVTIFFITKLSQNPSKFYLLFSLVPFFGMYGVTPVVAVYVGLSLGALYLVGMNQQRNL